MDGSEEEPLGSIAGGVTHTIRSERNETRPLVANELDMKSTLGIEVVDKKICEGAMLHGEDCTSNSM